MFSSWLHIFKSTVSFAFIGSYSDSSWGRAKILGENLVILKLNWSICPSEVKFIHLSFHIPWCNSLSVLDWDLTFISLLILCAWSNDLTLHQSDTAGLWELCRESHQVAFAGVDLPWLSQTKGATWVKVASWISKDYSSLSTCVPRLFQPLHLCPVWWALQPAVLFPKCCVEEGITSWLWWMWVARGMLLQRSVKLKSWILVILWNVLLLGTGRQTEKRLSQRKKVLRWKIVAGRQAYRESLKYWYLFCVWKSRFWGNVPRLFKLKRISFFEGHNDRSFPRSTGKRTRSNWLYFQARY